MSRRTLVVIPCFRESTRIGRLLAEIGRTPPPQGHEVGYLLVDDGSPGQERERLRALLEEHGLQSAVGLRSLQRNEGKGAAIRAGFREGLKGSWDYLAFIDADGSVPLAQLHRALRHLEAHEGEGLAGVVGSRVKMLGRTVERRPLRHYLGRLFATFVSAYFGVPAYDTQCGLKVFRREALARCLEIPVDTRWVWDTQLLLAMLDGREAIDELPVDWREVPGSRLSLWGDGVAMLLSLIRFRPDLRARAPRGP